MSYKVKVSLIVKISCCYQNTILYCTQLHKVFSENVMVVVAYNGGHPPTFEKPRHPSLSSSSPALPFV